MDQDLVSTLLQKIGLGHLYEVFQNEAIEIGILAEMTNADLEHIGISKFGDRHKILNAVKGWKSSIEVSEFENSSDDAGYEDISQYSDLPRNLSTDSNLSGVSTITEISDGSGFSVYPEKPENYTRKNSNSSQYSSSGESSEQDIYEVQVEFQKCFENEEVDDRPLPGIPQQFEERIAQSAVVSKSKIKGSRLQHRPVGTTANAHVAALLYQITDFRKKAYDMLSQTYKDLAALRNYNGLEKEVINELFMKHGNLEQTLIENTKDLEDFSCPIVVTGETSAGKSSFINLLLGVELLPQSSLSCTSTICRVHNKQEKAVTCIDQNDHEKKLPIASDISLEDMRNILKHHVRVKHKTGKDTGTENAAKDEAEYKFIDICWPIPCLDESIVIVDTPGVGPDYPDLTRRLFQYLPKALAFIYVLNTPNAGGVQRDRIIKIKRELEKHSKKENVPQLLDPRRAIFICNKWDQIHEDPEDVFATVESTLQDLWPDFQHDKLFKLSAREEMNTSMKGRPITKEFSDILKEIENMIPAITSEKYRRHLRWQYWFIEACLKKVHAKIKMTQKSKEEKARIAESIRRKIAEVEEMIPTVGYLGNYEVKRHKREAVRSQVMIYCDQIANDVHIHLNKSDTIEKMFSWTDDQLPNDSDLEVIVAKIDELILDRLNDELKNRMYRIEKPKLENFIKDVFDKDCFQVLKKCESFDHALFGDDYDFFESKEETAEPDNNDDPDISLSLKAKIILAVTSPISVPTAIALGLVAAIVVLPVTAVVLIRDKIMHNKIVSKYRKDKDAFAKKRTSIYLKVINVEKLKELIMPLLLKSVDGVFEVYFEKIIPNRLLDGQNMVNQLKADLSTPRELRRQCHSMEKHILRINDRVVASFVELFKENMIMQEDITQISDGDFNDIAEIKRNKHVYKSRVVTIAYSTSENNKTKYNGIAKISVLRKLHHRNLTTVYGICPFVEKERVRYDAFIEFCEQNLDIEVISEGIRWSKSKEYIQNAIEGLSYLHLHGLVHTDIRLSTILISEGEAKLSYGNFGVQCTPTGKIDDVPIIMAPEAIKSTASFEADIFQVGIVIWEAFCGKRAYYKEDKPIRETYEDLYLVIDSGERPDILQLNSNTRFLVQDCWHADSDKRPSLPEIKQRLAAVA